MARQKSETIEREPVSITEYARKKSARSASARAVHATEPRVAASTTSVAPVTPPTRAARARQPRLSALSTSAAAPATLSVASRPLRYQAVPAVRPIAPIEHSYTPTPAVPAKAPTRQAKKPSVRQCLGELRSLLADGFEIVQPIFARPLWTVTDNSATAFNFVLCRERATKLVTVPEGRTVQRFIRDRQLIVDYRY